MHRSRPGRKPIATLLEANEAVEATTEVLLWNYYLMECVAENCACSA